MKLTLAEPKYLKESISIISDLVNEARFKITKEAVELVAMDPANVAMVIFKLLSSAFSEYNVDTETELAINLTNLKQILRRAKPSDVLTLEVTDDNRVKIQLKGSTTRTFSLPIIDLEEKEQKIPTLEFPISITTKNDILNEAIEDVGIVSESVTFSAEKGKATIMAEGDLSHAKVEIPEGPETKVKAKGEPVKAKYSIEYLKKMVQGGKIADTVVISFNKDYPLKIDFNVIDKVGLSFILAPRVENE